MNTSALALYLVAFAAAGVAGSAGAAVTSDSGSVAVVANVALGISNPKDSNGNDVPPTIVSSNTASDAHSWVSAPTGLSASAATSTSLYGDTVSALANVAATWTSANSGSVTFRDYGWNFNVTDPANSYSEADLNNNRGGSDWSYSFTVDTNSVFTMTYNTTGTGSTFGLWGFPINGLSGTGGPVLNPSDPNASGTFVADLAPGSYTVSIDSFPNVSSGNWQTSASMNGQFDWTIADSPAPEPAMWSLMILGVGGMGAALRTRRRKSEAA